MSEVTVTGLRAVREIALSGSFTAAARLLGYSQPAISRQVAAMEAAAGQPLFVREGRGVRVSAAGAVVVEHAGRILAGIGALEQDLASLDDRLAGRVRLGAFPSATAVLVPRAIARLRTEHPGLDVALTEAATPALVRQLRARRLDVAVIGVGAGLPDYDLTGLEQEVVSAGGLCVAVPAAHRLAGSGVVPVAELAGETWIAGPGGDDPQFRAWPTLADPVLGHAVRGWPARLGLVAAGLGVCLMPVVAAPSVPAGVVTVGVDDPGWPGRRTVALTREARGAEAAGVVSALRRAGEELGA
ncbi:LysR substrate-binding domain-containing protein [Amycolatopsis rhabdoformis]|uniref:LysR substrate-binding domain-containing protein n=1 Tax=Amycolatopsis rhabdoformis TaxID=1448059 RepID=A0ABZ1ICW3_9PSEU|nr:LysR substrate-binding domain-containing protein [Amycolatopsis rhabdoformis]WSE31978.1 LysR substrate-binding domain-containing protein [Amycolatopsis rhabdoformis]